jgi:hypothetical protein
MFRINEIFRFNHVVLLVTSQAMLRAECSGNVDALINQRIQRVRARPCYRSGMSDKPHTFSLQD